MVDKREATLDIEMLLKHIIQKEVIRMLEPIQDEIYKLNARVYDLEHNRFIQSNVLVHDMNELKGKVDYLLPHEDD